MRFKEIREQRKLKQWQVAAILELPLRTYQNYEREINEPDTEVLCKLADYYGVTVDYLIGYSDIAFAAGDGEIRTAELSQDENELLADYRAMNDQGKIMAREIVAALAKSGEYAV